MVFIQTIVHLDLFLTQCLYILQWRKLLPRIEPFYGKNFKFDGCSDHRECATTAPITTQLAFLTMAKICRFWGTVCPR